MNGVGHLAVQNEHKRWQAEHAKWLGDISRWQAEHQTAMFELDRLEAFLRTHADAVRTHADAIDSHEQVVRKPGAADAHRELAAKHQQQREIHARVADRHQGVMTQLNRLVQLIRETA